MKGMRANSQASTIQYLALAIAPFIAPQPQLLEAGKGLNPCLDVRINDEGDK